MKWALLAYTVLLLVAAVSSEDTSEKSSVEASVESSVVSTVEASVESSVEASVESSEKLSEESTVEASVESPEKSSEESTVEASVESPEKSSEESSEKSPEESPEKSSEESPEKSSEESPEKSSEESPEKSSEESSEEPPEKSSEESTVESPEKSSEESPEKSSEESPEKSSEESPEKSSEESSEEPPEKSSEESTAEASVESPEKSSEESTVEASVESPEKSSEEASVESSEESSEKSSEEASAESSEESSVESSEESLENPSEDGLVLAEDCDEAACQLPDCRCSTTKIPGGLAARDTPQFVMLTFDDGINVLNIETYRKIVYNRRNINNCPIGTTFFINHEYTNYELVNELYNNGFEIALHSISHQTPPTYWADATYDTMKEEFADQKVLISHFANIPYDEIKGMRIPFLQLSGNASFEMMAKHDLQYDSSWPTVSHVNPGLWPYTLDYASTQDCVSQPCPDASIPGVWVLPMISWQDLQGIPCAMVDSCFFVPPHNDEDGWFNFMVTNFERHYLGNRAPFPFYIHEWFLNNHPAVSNALLRFITLLNNMHDVFMVNSHEVIDWVKEPVTIDEYRQKPCRWFFPTTCPARDCGPLYSVHNPWGSYWMQACNVCPNVYPWLRNPLGQ